MNKTIYMCLIAVLLIGCTQTTDKGNNDIEQIIERGQLRAVTLESAISYYMVGEDEVGFDFALAQNLADHLGVELKIVIASSEQQLKDMLKKGEADFAAYKISTTKAVGRDFIITDVEAMSNVVLVQAKNRKPLKNIMQLIDKDVYVQRHTKYNIRLKHLNEEIGGGINIKYLSDTLRIEEIMYRVSQNKIPFTVADDDIAELSQKYFKNLDIGLPISLALPKAWIVRKDAPKLDSVINDWYAGIEKSKYLKRMKERYLSRSRYFDNFDITVAKGSISPYDSIFKANARVAGWDWRLLAAVAYHESRFNPNTISPNGAMGVMQLMRRTGLKYGLNDSTFFEPADNIAAGAKLIASLNKMFAFVGDENERIKFVLASYNSGQGHVLDAVSLTKKYGGNHQVWSGNIEKYLMLKSKEKYYNDEVTKLGYFKANHTVKFVKDVLATYDKYMGVKVPI